MITLAGRRGRESSPKAGHPRKGDVWDLYKWYVSRFLASGQAQPNYRVFIPFQMNDLRILERHAIASCLQRREKGHINGNGTANTISVSPKSPGNASPACPHAPTHSAPERGTVLSASRRPRNPALQRPRTSLGGW